MLKSNLAKRNHITLQAKQAMKNVTTTQTIKFIWSYFCRFPAMVFAAYFLVTLSVIAELANPYIMSKIIDTISNNALPTDGRLNEAIFWVVAMTIQGLLFHLTLRSAHLLNCNLDSRVQSLVAAEALDVVQRFSTDWHNNSFAGSTVTKIKRGMRAAHIFFDIILYDLYTAFGVVIGLVVINIFKNTLLSIIFAIFTIFYVTTSTFLALYYVAPQRRRANKEDNRVGATLADTISCNATVKSFGGEKREKTYFHNVITNWRNSARKAWIRSNILSIVQNILILGLKLSLFSTAVFLWYKGTLTIADFVFVLSSYLVFTGAFRPIGDRIRDLQEAVSDIEDVIVFHHTSVDVKDAPNAKAIKVTHGKIEIKNVSFHYNSNKSNIYEKFSLTIEPGEKVALVGHSGSGKSTMVKLIQRLYNIQQGTIFIDGQNIAEVTQASLRSNIALVPQDPILFHRTLQENITYAKPNASSQELEKAAKLAHAYEFIKELPQQYQTLVGERGVKLSGGERQRIAISRAMLADSPILILDEATSSLDSQSEALIQEALKSLMKNRTSIVIAHRLSTIKSADRILVFDKGKIIEQGNHKTLVQKAGGAYKKLYEMQVGGFLGDTHSQSECAYNVRSTPYPNKPELLDLPEENPPENTTSEAENGV